MKTTPSSSLGANQKVRWGILSTGRIAGLFAEGVLGSKTGRLAAVGSRSIAPALAFARKYKVPKVHGNYQALLNDPTVDAVYIAPPHPFHVEWAVKAARAGKHVLCEKPLGMNLSEAKRMVEAAKKNRVFFMEAFMYRCLPQTAKIVQLIRQDLIGEVRLIQASFIFNAPFDAKHRLFSKKLGGGGILDIGCYPASFSRLVAGAAVGKLFQDPVSVKGFVHRGKTGVDEWATANLKFKGEIFSQITCGTRTEGESVARVYGTKGTLFIPSPWFGSWGAGKSKIVYQRSWNKKPRTIQVKADRMLYSLEADEVGRCLGRGLQQSPAMSWGDSLGNAKVLDQWMQMG